MQRKKEQQAPETRCKTDKPRFQIQKLEERIAPAKGGIPGKPPNHSPPGQNCYYGFCCRRGCDL